MGTATNNGGGCYTLTRDSVWQQGTAWCNLPINLTQSLTIQYNLNFGINDATGADGIAFVLQNQGTAVVGASGQGMGYQGITPSVIIEFDEFQNGFDPANDHVGVILNGDPDHTTAANVGNPLASFPFNIEDGNWHAVEISWDPAVHILKVYFDCQLYITYTNDIMNTVFSGNPVAYWGFTSATGGASNLQQFCYAPPFVVTLDSTDVTCFGQCNGSADVTNISGVSGPYSYLWDNGETTSMATGLCAGTNTVTVTSSLGCIATATVAINEPTAVTGNITTLTNVTCFGGNNGSATASGSGGTGSFTYSWNSTPSQTGATANNLAAGNYTVTIQDANSCQATQTVNITEPTALTYTSTQTNATCFGNSNGSASVTPSGGTAPYSYAWNTNPAQTTPLASGMGAGSYSCLITDAQGCTMTETFTITEPVAVTVTISATVPVSCFGGNDGSATASGNGGTGTITYLWNTSPAQASPNATGLIAGNYTVTATDANGCTAAANTAITEPAAMNLSTSSTIASCGMNDGTATVNPSGGVTPYTYLWLIAPIVQTTPTITITAGTYSVVVTDSLGCAQVQSVVVPGVAPPVADFYFDPTDGISMLDPVVAFQDASQGVFSSIAWNFGDTGSGGDNISALTDPFHAYSDTGLYCITLMISTPSGACADTITKCLKVDALYTFYIPNSFTPNHDGNNEIFIAQGTYISAFHMYIFDRWGNIIFESNDIHKGWDGTIKNNGNKLQEDVYVWKVSLTDTNMQTHEYIGHVNIVR